MGDYLRVKAAGDPYNYDYPARPPARFELTVLSVVAPFQIEGEICGIPFYYRERHDRWRLESTLNGMRVERAHGDGELEEIGPVIERILTIEPWRSAYSEFL